MTCSTSEGCTLYGFYGIDNKLKLKFSRLPHLVLSRGVGLKIKMSQFAIQFCYETNWGLAMLWLILLATGQAKVQL
jgi:hypothetical protein